jgi:hypothetical protein
MKSKLILGLALVLSGSLFISMSTGAVENPKEFTPDLIEKMWPEIWKESDPETKVPAIDPLTEQQASKEMSGRWFILSGSFKTDKIIISVETNRQASVSGVKEGKAWQADGQWLVVSNKLVLLVKSDNPTPDYIFRIKGKPYMYDGWSKTLMTELKREEP